MFEQELDLLLARSRRARARARQRDAARQHRCGRIAHGRRRADAGGDRRFRPPVCVRARSAEGRSRTVARGAATRAVGGGIERSAQQRRSRAGGERRSCIRMPGCGPGFAVGRRHPHPAGRRTMRKSGAWATFWAGRCGPGDRVARMAAPVIAVDRADLGCSYRAAGPAGLGDHRHRLRHAGPARVTPRRRPRPTGRSRGRSATGRRRQAAGPGGPVRPGGPARLAVPPGLEVPPGGGPA